jgi:hypothetical protein
MGGEKKWNRTDDEKLATLLKEFKVDSNRSDKDYIKEVYAK